MGEHVTYYCDLCGVNEGEAGVYQLSEDVKDYFKRYGSWAEMVLKDLCEDCMEEKNDHHLRQLVIKGDKIVFKDNK